MPAAESRGHALFLCVVCLCHRKQFISRFLRVDSIKFLRAVVPMFARTVKVFHCRIVHPGDSLSEPFSLRFSLLSSSFFLDCGRET